MTVKLTLLDSSNLFSFVAARLLSKRVMKNTSPLLIVPSKGVSNLLKHLNKISIVRGLKKHYNIKKTVPVQYM